MLHFHLIKKFLTVWVLCLMPVLVLPGFASAKGEKGDANPYPLPVISFQVEDEHGLEVAKRCGEIWAEEGPVLVAELVNMAQAAPDTIVCLILATPAFQKYFEGRAPDWGVGIAVPAGNLIAIDYSRLSHVGRGVREVFLHEMTHALLFKASGGTWLPTWFHEGVAMSFSGEWRFVDTFSLMLEGRVPKLDQLQGRFPRSAITADQAYRTSLLAINHLRKTYGEDILANLVAASAREGDFSLGFYAATGSDLRDFTNDFTQTMSLRFGWLIMLTRWPTLFVVMGLILAVSGTRKIISTRRRLAEMEDDEDEDFPDELH